ncbi:MAG TPA: hypothetical protein VG347_24675 [Verrucomicrobiae bacterium]|nr:hypothetical protein [Verrucomicrobiae bacterium]
MRKILFLTGCLLAGYFTVLASESRGTMDFTNATLIQVLDVYQKMSGQELAIDSAVNRNAKLTLRTTNQVTKAEAMKLIEQSVATQAHVVITRIDDKRASVTLEHTKLAKP